MMSTVTNARPFSRIWPFLLLFAVGFLCMYRPVWDMDFGWHLASGRWILEQGHVPRTDPFSFLTGGRDWIDHEWAAHVGMAWVEGFAGIEGLKVLAALIVGSSCVLFAMGFARRGFTSIGVLGAVFLLLYLFESRLRIRPHLLTLLGASLLYALPMGKLSLGKALGLILFYLVWLNCHGGWILAPIHALALALMAWLSDDDPDPYLSWAGIFAILSLFNPYFYRLPLSTLRISEVATLIPEWKPIFVLGPEHNLRALLSVGLALLSLAAIAVSWQRRHGDAETLAPTVYGQPMGLSSQRFLFLQALALPLIARMAWTRRIPTTLWALLALLPLGLEQGQRWLKLTESVGGPARAWVQGKFPEEAVAWIQEQDLRGNLLCPPAWAGYCVLQLGERVKIAVDGRLELFDPDLAERIRLLYVPGSRIHYTLEQKPDILVQPRIQQQGRLVGIPLPLGLKGLYRKIFESPRAEVWQRN